MGKGGGVIVIILTPAAGLGAGATRGSIGAPTGEVKVGIASVLGWLGGDGWGGEEEAGDGGETRGEPAGPNKLGRRLKSGEGGVVD